jgi:hypothetical protein
MFFEAGSTTAGEVIGLELGTVFMDGGSRTR